MSIVSFQTKAELDALSPGVSALVSVAFVEELANAGLYVWNAGTSVWDLRPAKLIGANPTATAGIAAVNGTAATFMRSDAAPAIPAATTTQYGLVKLGDTVIPAGHTDGQYPAAGLVGECIRGITTRGSTTMAGFSENDYLLGSLTLTPGNWAISVACNMAPVVTSATGENINGLYYWSAYIELIPPDHSNDHIDCWISSYTSNGCSTATGVRSLGDVALLVLPVLHYSTWANKTLTLKANISLGTYVQVGYDADSLVAVRES